MFHTKDQKIVLWERKWVADIWRRNLKNDLLDTYN